MFEILNGYENIDINSLFSRKKDNRTRGHDITLVKISAVWISGSTHTHRGHSMNGTNYIQIWCN